MEPFCKSSHVAENNCKNACFEQQRITTKRKSQAEDSTKGTKGACLK